MTARHAVHHFVKCQVVSSWHSGNTLSAHTRTRLHSRLCWLWQTSATLKNCIKACMAIKECKASPFCNIISVSIPLCAQVTALACLTCHSCIESISYKVALTCHIHRLSAMRHLCCSNTCRLPWQAQLSIPSQFFFDSGCRLLLLRLRFAISIASTGSDTPTSCLNIVLNYANIIWRWRIANVHLYTFQDTHQILADGSFLLWL